MVPVLYWARGLLRPVTHRKHRNSAGNNYILRDKYHIVTVILQNPTSHYFILWLCKYFMVCITSAGFFLQCIPAKQLSGSQSCLGIDLHSPAKARSVLGTAQVLIAAQQQQPPGLFTYRGLNSIQGPLHKTLHKNIIGYNALFPALCLIISLSVLL